MVNPLKVAFLVKQSPSTRLRETRNMGLFSYPVDEFTWEHDTPNTGALLLDNYRNYDVVIQEDAGGYEVVRGRCSPPLVYVAIDSTLSEQHFDARYERARRADLVLVDHDDLRKFRSTGKPVRRLTYCVNDMLYYPAPVKDIDVNFHCGGGAARGMPGGVERAEMRAFLGELCRELEWKFVSGGVGLEQYAVEMGRSKVVVNWPRTDINRSHRIFDALASGCCLATRTFPDYGSHLVGGLHYITYKKKHDLRDALEEVMDSKWQRYASDGSEHVLKHHTWATRATELRMILAEELKI